MSEQENQLVAVGKSVSIPVEWKTNEAGMKAIKDITNSMKATGPVMLMASIPIICRGESCHYIETCAMKALGNDVADFKDQRCPVEISKMMNKFEKYVKHFEVNLDETDEVVLGLVKELVDYEVQLDRVEQIMSKEGTFMEYTIVGVDSNGKPIRNRDIAKTVDFKERVTKKRNDVYQLLNSTPKDKAGLKINIAMDPSTYASNLLARAAELELNGGIQVIDLHEIADEVIREIEMSDE